MLFAVIGTSDLPVRRTRARLRPTFADERRLHPRVRVSTLTDQAMDVPFLPRRARKEANNPILRSNPARRVATEARVRANNPRVDP